MSKPKRSYKWAERKVALACAIMRRGWRRGKPCDHDGNRCAIGALYRSVSGVDTDRTTVANAYFNGHPEYAPIAARNDYSADVHEAIQRTRPLMWWLLRRRYDIPKRGGR